MNDLIPMILANMLPLYGLIVLGYIAGKFLNVRLHSVSRINIFILLPIVQFGAMMNLQFNASLILLPILTCMTSYAITLSAHKIAGLYWTDGTENLIAASGVNGNAIYFGLPIITALFGAEGLAIYLFMNLGGAINNLTLGNYMTARGRFTVQDSIRKVITFPAIYAVIIGLILNAIGVEMHEVAVRYWDSAKGAMVFLGMMMIGVGISQLDRLSFDIKELCAYTLVKSVAWPVVMCGAALLDHHVFGLFASDIHKMMMVFSAMPVMGSLVAYAAEYKLHPERAASAVLVSSVSAAALIPLMLILIERLGI